MADAKPVIGFDLGGTKMLAGVVDKDFKIGKTKKKKTRGKDPDEGTFERMVATIESVLEKADLTTDGIAGIGIGSPGPLNQKTGVIGNTPNLGWDGFPLRDKMKRKFGVPVTVGNDVDMGTYGEFHFGAAKGARNVLGVFPGTGIGGGLILNGRLHVGSSGAAGEIGHVVVDPTGPRCGCGNRGCLESFAARWAIASRLALLAMRGDAPALNDEAGRDPLKYKSKTILRAIEAGDKAVEEVLRDAASLIGLVISGVVNVVSPDVIVLGGGLVEAMPKLFIEEVSAAVKEHTLPEIGKGVKVVDAKLGDDAVLMGAAKTIREAVEGDGG